MFANIFIAVGKPIRVDKIESPTEEQIAKLHKVYIDSLQELFARYKNEYGTADTEEISLL